MPQTIHDDFGVLGGKVVVRKTDEGDYICPICGMIHEGTSEFADPKAYFHGNESCPGCEYEFGFHDAPRCENESRMAIWALLRQQWLHKHSHESALVSRLCSNLEMTREQLDRERDEVLRYLDHYRSCYGDIRLAD